MKLKFPRPSGGAVSAAPSAGPDPELVAQRDRLAERFALAQSELGGLFYEMAIRDHVRMEVLIERAAAMQKIDLELAQFEHLLSQGDQGAAGNCPNCGTPHARGAAFCSQCAAALVP